MQRMAFFCLAHPVEVCSAINPSLPSLHLPSPPLPAKLKLSCLQILVYSSLQGRFSLSRPWKKQGSCLTASLPSPSVSGRARLHSLFIPQ